MKGAIFIALNQMVETQHGMVLWEDILDRVKPLSGGIYTSIEAYSDGELFDLVDALAHSLNTNRQTLLKEFGGFLFTQLNNKYPMFTQSEPDFIGFIKSIDGVIHKEVYKLYKNPQLPSLQVDQVDKNNLLITYRSQRKLCHLAEGLLAGAADYYQITCKLDHKRCMHSGSDHCLIGLQIQ